MTIHEPRDDYDHHQNDKTTSGTRHDKGQAAYGKGSMANGTSQMAKILSERAGDRDARASSLVLSHFTLFVTPLASPRHLSSRLVFLPPTLSHIARHTNSRVLLSHMLDPNLTPLALVVPSCHPCLLSFSRARGTRALFHLSISSPRH